MRKMVVSKQELVVNNALFSIEKEVLSSNIPRQLKSRIEKGLFVLMLACSIM